jgi:hypothetical protein
MCALSAALFEFEPGTLHASSTLKLMVLERKLVLLFPSRSCQDHRVPRAVCRVVIVLDTGRAKLEALQGGAMMQALEDLERQTSRLRLRVQEEISGASAARNEALSTAHSKYVVRLCFLDHAAKTQRIVQL